MTLAWSPQRIQAESKAQAESLIGALVELFSTPNGRRQAKEGYGVSEAEMDSALAELRSPAIVPVVAEMFAEKLRAGATLANVMTQEEIADPYNDPAVLARILRDNFPKFREKVCGAT